MRTKIYKNTIQYIRWDSKPYLNDNTFADQRGLDRSATLTLNKISQIMMLLYSTYSKKNLYFANLVKGYFGSCKLSVVS